MIVSVLQQGKFMSKTVYLVGTAVLALFAGVNAGASPVHVITLPTAGLTTLWDQSAADGGGTGIDSMNFTSAEAQFDSAGADDFVVPAGQKWDVKEVDASGKDTGGGAAFFNVFFYKNKNSFPNSAKVVRTCLNQTNFTDVNGGDIAIALTGCSGRTLRGGRNGRTYWVSVVGNQSAPGTLWRWFTNAIQNGNGSAWENPPNGFGTTCTTWGRTQSCFPDGGGPDFAFALKGTVK